MGRFIKVPLTKQMEEDHKECIDMAEYGMEKDCDSCSLNEGNLNCLDEYPWCAEWDERKQ